MTPYQIQQKMIYDAARELESMTGRAARVSSEPDPVETIYYGGMNLRLEDAVTEAVVAHDPLVSNTPSNVEEPDEDNGIAELDTSDMQPTEPMAVPEEVQAPESEQSAVPEQPELQTYSAPSPVPTFESDQRPVVSTEPVVSTPRVQGESPPVDTGFEPVAATVESEKPTPVERPVRPDPIRVAGGGSPFGLGAPAESTHFHQDTGRASDLTFITTTQLPNTGTSAAASGAHESTNALEEAVSEFMATLISFMERMTENVSNAQQRIDALELRIDAASELDD